MGDPGRGLPRAKIMQISKYSVTSSSDPEVEQSSYVVFKYLLMWRIKVVHGSSQGPGGGGGGGGVIGSGRGPKKLLFHLIQNTSFGVGDSELFKVAYGNSGER